MPEDKPKRKRGRPKKSEAAPPDVLAEESDKDETKEKESDPIPDTPFDEETIGLEIKSEKDCRNCGRFEMRQDNDASWHWMLFSANGRPIATNPNPEGFVRRNDLQRQILAVKEEVGPAPVVIHQLEGEEI